MKNIFSSIFAALALTASAEYIRQATETYPGGGSTIRDYTTTNAVKDIVSSASVTNAGAVAVAEGRYLKKIGPNNNTDIHWDGTTTPDSLVVEPETTFERNVNFGGGLSINGTDMVFNCKTISAPGEDGTMALKTDIPSVWSWNDIEDTPKDISGYGITNAYTKSEINAKGFVTESITNGILTAAKTYADRYANQAPDYANVSNLASTAIQTHQSLSVTNDYIRLDGTSVMTGLLRADKGVYVGSHSVILGTKGIGGVSAGDYITYNGSESTYEFGWYTFPTNSYSFLFNGSDDDLGIWPKYGTHGKGTFNVNPVGGLSGFWIGETNLESIVDVKTAAATNALATVAHTGSYNDLTDRPSAGGLTTNDVKNIVSDMSIDTISNKASGAFIKYDLSARLDASTAAWMPNSTPIPENPTLGSTYYSNVHWHGLTWACEKYLYSSGMWGRIDAHAMMSGSSLDINATDLEFPDGTPTKRTINTKLATTNDLGYVLLSAKEYADQYANQAPDYANVSNKAMNAEKYTDDQITDFNTTTVNPIHTSVTNLQAYLGGQNVRVSVTNYYAASSGNLPRLRIEENVSNNWNTVWDEDDKFGLFQSNIVVAVADMTNTTITVVTNALHAGLATKAPLAWGSVTSRGGTTPDDTVWISHPKTVFAGDAEFQSVAVGAGEIYVVVSKGTGVYSQGNPGTFRFTTADNDWYFGMRIEDSYLLGCNTDGITVTPIAGGNMVTLDYNVTMVGKPILYYKSALTNEVWEQLNDSTGAPIPGASVVVSWEAAPPAAHEYAYINVGAAPQGYFTAYVETAGSQSFETNLPIDAKGGILCSNETTHAINVIEPYFDAGGEIKWRVKP